VSKLLMHNLRAKLYYIHMGLNIALFDFDPSDVDRLQYTQYKII
jgi:hypothetical protein